jgi:hypothetical protein
MAVSLGYIGAYVVLVGVASFIESPVGRGLGPFQLNALIRTGSLVAALVALVLTHGFGIPASPSALAGIAIRAPESSGAQTIPNRSPQPTNAGRLSEKPGNSVAVLPPA